MDRIAIYQQIPTPFAWFGIRPELFGTSARFPVRPGLAGAQLPVHLAGCRDPRRVRAVAGFSWGFTINDQTITIAAPQVLGPQAWDSQLCLLRNQYPQWAFDTGYASS